jgi:nucleotide-binding universal stress UspA family protein
MSLVLVPIDGSDRSDQTLAGVADRLRHRPGLRVALLFVHEPPMRYGRILVHQPLDTLDALRAERAAVVLRASAERLRASGLEVETRVESGELYATIARVARQLGASEVVLGVRTPWPARVARALVRRLRPLEALHVPVTYRT